MREGALTKTASKCIVMRKILVYALAQLMTRTIALAILAFSALFLGACIKDPPPKPSSGGWQKPTPKPKPKMQAPVEEEEEEEDSSPTTGNTNPAPTPKPAKVPVGDLPYGKPVDGKPGYVTSPFFPGSGYVDVRGLPPGTEVECPFSKEAGQSKTFLVP